MENNQKKTKYNKTLKLLTWSTKYCCLFNKTPNFGPFVFLLPKILKLFDFQIFWL